MLILFEISKQEGDLVKAWSILYRQSNTVVFNYKEREIHGSAITLMGIPAFHHDCCESLRMQLQYTFPTFFIHTVGMVVVRIS